VLRDNWILKKTTRVTTIMHGQLNIRLLVDAAKRISKVNRACWRGLFSVNHQKFYIAVATKQTQHVNTISQNKSLLRTRSSSKTPRCLYFVINFCRKASLDNSFADSLNSKADACDGTVFIVGDGRGNCSSCILSNSILLGCCCLNISKICRQKMDGKLCACAIFYHCFNSLKNFLTNSYTSNDTALAGKLRTTLL